MKSILQHSYTSRGLQFVVQYLEKVEVSWTKVLKKQTLQTRSAFTSEEGEQWRETLRSIWTVCSRPWYRVGLQSVLDGWNKECFEIYFFSNVPFINSLCAVPANLFPGTKRQVHEAGAQLCLVARFKNAQSYPQFNAFYIARDKLILNCSSCSNVMKINL